MVLVGWHTASCKQEDFAKWNFYYFCAILWYSELNRFGSLSWTYHLVQTQWVYHTKISIEIPNFSGPKLPHRLSDSVMVTSLNNTGVILIGGEKSIYSISARDIIELRGNSVENLEWTILEQKIQFKREDHVAFPVLNLFVNCNEN